MPPTLEPPSKSASESAAKDPLSVSLGSAFKTTLAKVQSDAITNPAPPGDAAASDAAARDAAKEELAREAQEKAAIAEAADKAAKEKSAAGKPKSALDIALGGAKADVVAPVDEDAPADAPVKQLRDAYTKLKQEHQRVQADLSKLSAPDPAIAQQIETLQKERDTLRAETAKQRSAILALNVDYDPATQAKFVEGKQRLLEKAALRTKEYGGDAAAFAEAMQLPPGKKRTDAMKDAILDVDEIDRPSILSIVEQIRALDEEYAELKKDPQQAWQALSDQRKAQQQAAFEQGEKAKREVMEKTLSTLPEKAKLFNRVPADAEGADDWNNGIDGAIEYGKHLMGDKAQPHEIAEAAYKAGRYDFVESLLLSERARWQTTETELRTQLAKYESSDTSFGGRQKSNINDPLSKTPAEIYRIEMEKKKQTVV